MRSERRLFLLDTIVHLVHDETLNAKHFDGFGNFECGPMFNADKDVGWFTLESDAEVEKGVATMSKLKDLLGAAMGDHADASVKEIWNDFEGRMKQNGEGLPIRVLSNGERRYQLNLYEGKSSIWRDGDMKEAVEGSCVRNDNAPVMPKQMIVESLLRGWKGVEGGGDAGKNDIDLG